MPDLRYHRLFRHDAFNGRELSVNYISDTAPCGRLFIVLEVQKNKIDQQPLLEQIISEAANMMASSKNSNPEIVLEDILQKINSLLPELSAASKIRNWLYGLDMAIGIFNNEAIHLSNIGQINGLALSRHRLEAVLHKKQNFSPSKAFTDIHSGLLEEGDVFIISTNSLLDYIAQEKIRQIAKRYTPQASIIKLNSLLATVPDFVTFNAIIIKNSGAGDYDQVAVSNIPVEANDEIEKKSDIISYHRPKTSNRRQDSSDFEYGPSVSPLQKIKRFFAAVALFFISVYKVIRFFYRQIKNGILFIFSPHWRKQKEEQVLSEVKNTFDQKYNWWQKLKSVQKIALVGLLLTILIFIQSLIFLTQKKSVSQKDKVYQELISSIDNKFAEAESKLIYNDQIAAENILLEIQATLDNLKLTSKQQEEEIATFKEKTRKQLNEVRRIHDVPEPLELSSLASLMNPQQIVQKDGNFYILDSQKIYLLKDRTLSALSDFNQGKFFADWPQSKRLVVGNSEQFFIYDITENKQANFPLSQSAGNTSVQDLNIYSNNLYVLDSKGKQFFKYPENSASFSNGQAWLKEEVDLQDVSSFTVDGSIYTIDNQGQIKKFTKGKAEEFNYQTPNPKIGAKATIQTFRDSKYLYIIDPSNQRVVILNKDGNIKDQYTSLKFDQLLDLAIDPNEQAIYLLNGQHLYLLAVNQ